MSTHRKTNSPAKATNLSNQLATNLSNQLDTILSTNPSTIDGKHFSELLAESI
jgi:hypothetical protein